MGSLSVLIGVLEVSISKCFNGVRPQFEGGLIANGD